MARKEGSAEEPFELGMSELEKIVARLEQGNLPLEEALNDFEKGVGLLRRLHAKLGDVEKRVEVLVRDAEGVLRARETERGPVAATERPGRAQAAGQSARAPEEDEDGPGEIGNDDVPF